jgi:hypothetical protein
LEKLLVAKASATAHWMAERQSRSLPEHDGGSGESWGDAAVVVRRSESGCAGSVLAIPLS